MRSSKAAFDLIVAHEVSSRAMYEKRYQRPILPGEQSGITVGIGYDLGYATPEEIEQAWRGKIHPNMVRALQKVSGLRRAAARAKLAEAKRDILIPWDAAIAVFKEVSLPKYEAMALRACPGSEALPAGCFGVLASLTYNRGPSFTKARGSNDTLDRYREMRAIRAHIRSGDWAAVPAEIRSMKRLWDRRKSPGLHRRRDEEAALWKASLDAAVSDAPIDEGVEREEADPVADDGDIIFSNTRPPLNNTGINIQPKRKGHSPEVEAVQRQLLALKYYEVGVDGADGLLGAKTKAAITAFMVDRGKDPNRGQITDELKNELEQARSETLPNGRPWSRPIPEDRARATAKDIAGKVGSINPTWWQKVLAWILGLPAAITAGFKGVFGEDTPGGYIYQIKSIFSAIPTEFYLLGVVGLAVTIYFAAKSAQDHTVRDYNEGKIN